MICVWCYTMHWMLELACTHTHSHIYTYAINWIKCRIKVMEMVQQQKVAYGQTLTCLLARWLAGSHVCSISNSISLFFYNFYIEIIAYSKKEADTGDALLEGSHRILCLFSSSIYISFIPGWNDKTYVWIEYCSSSKVVFSLGQYHWGIQCNMNQNKR